MKKINHNYEISFNEALKYSMRSDFRKKSSTIYNYARLNGWLDDICKHMTESIKPNNYWNYERCETEALKYNTKNKFRMYSSGAYNSARLNGWLNDICKHMSQPIKSHGYWTKDRCHNLALSCSTKTEFSVKYNTAYKMAHKYGWIPEICQHMITCGNRYNRCIYAYEFPDNHVYVGLTYDIIKRNINRKSNYNDQVTKYIKKSKLKPNIIQLTDYLPVDDASNQEKLYIEKYKNCGWVVLNKIAGGGIGFGKIIWTYETIKNVALKFNKKSEFRKNYSGAYDSAWKNGWLNDICSHMNNKIHLTKELCFNEAIKYNSRTDLFYNNRYVYEISKKNGWLNEFLPKRKRK